MSGNSFEFESARYDIEHVLPEHPDDDWGQFDEQQREVSTHRLGNMTLLESVRNRELGNKGFVDKRQVFLDSEFAVTRRLAEEFDSWTMDGDPHAPRLDGEAGHQHLASQPLNLCSSPRAHPGNCRREGP